MGTMKGMNMSKVIEPPVEPAAPAAEPDPWILDNEEPRDKKWILGEGEQPAPEAPPAAPVVIPPVGTRVEFSMARLARKYCAPGPAARGP